MGKEAAFLNDVAHFEAQGRQGCGQDFGVLEKEAALVRADEADDQAQDGGFAAAAGAQQDGGPAGGNGYGKIFQSRGLGIGFGEVMELNSGGGGRHHCFEIGFKGILKGKKAYLSVPLCSRPTAETRKKVF